MGGAHKTRGKYSTVVAVWMNEIYYCEKTRDSKGEVEGWYLCQTLLFRHLTYYAHLSTMRGHGLSCSPQYIYAMYV